MKKLVRDKIPQILEREGKKFRVVETVNDRDRLLRLLIEKLYEEVYEFVMNLTVEEAADVLEVLEAILRIKGYTFEDLIKVKKVKREERGGFNMGIVIEV